MLFEVVITAALLQNSGHLYNVRNGYSDSNKTDSGRLIQQVSEYSGLMLTDIGEVIPLGMGQSQYLLRIPFNRTYKYVSGNTKFGAAIDEQGVLHYWWGECIPNNEVGCNSGLPLDNYRTEAGPFTKVDADDECLLALREDGSLFYFDVLNRSIGVPSGTNFIDCDIESYFSNNEYGVHGAVITGTGEVVVFGIGEFIDEYDLWNKPDGGSFTKIAVTQSECFALKQNSTVWKWGSNESPNPINGNYTSIRAHNDSSGAAGIRTDGTVDWELDQEPTPGCTGCPSESVEVIDIAIPCCGFAILEPEQVQYQASQSNLDQVVSQTKPHDEILLSPGNYTIEYNPDANWSKSFIGSGVEETTIEFTRSIYPPVTVKNSTVILSWQYDYAGNVDANGSRFENCKIVNNLPDTTYFSAGIYVEFDNCQFEDWDNEASFEWGHFIFSNMGNIENLPTLKHVKDEGSYPKRCFVFKNCGSDSSSTTDAEESLITLVTGDVAHFVNTTFNDGNGVFGGFIHVAERGDDNFPETASLIRGGTFENGNALYGGAIYSKNPIQVIGSTFIGNSASHGGAVYATDQVSLGQHSDIVDCSFVNNASSDGSAIKSIQNYVNVGQCYFSGHEESMFGSIKSAFLISDSIFCENSSTSLQDEYDVIDLGTNIFDADCQTFDCNSNGILDIDELATGEGLDCNANGVLDDCDIASSFEGDCNSNQIPDSCEIADGLLDDCDTDGVPDVCTILDSPSQDSNNDGILDRCQCITDINGDGFTDFSDVLQLLSCWGSDPTGVCGFADVSEDGNIDFSDVLLMLNDFGPC